MPGQEPISLFESKK